MESIHNLNVFFFTISNRVNFLTTLKSFHYSLKELIYKAYHDINKSFVSS